ncbi:GntR family transcriptional regulator [Methylobacterium nigriterrae]|uniref:GntR family transcriptional regulator n=1 Tax=Methylobacterium nigriterrae TaxID=3127512 RepID=UPI0030133F6C
MASEAAEPQQAQLASRLRLRADTAQPMYRQLEVQLRQMISQGLLPAGATLPAERVLADALGVSRTTVKRCYGALRDQALLSAHGRLGFVVEGGRKPLNPGMDRLKGFTEEMRELGKVPSSQILERAAGPDRAIASLFGTPSNTPFLKLVRVRSGDGQPLSREIAWYDLGAAPALADADLSGSVYAALAQEGVALTHCEQTIEAAFPTPEECALFGFSEPVPCLLIKRRSRNAAGRMIEYVEGLFRGDCYAYRLNLRT